MQNIEIDIRKIYFKHFPTSDGDKLTPFMEELATFTMGIITKAKNEGYGEGAFISIREIEELLVVVRDYKELVQDVSRVNELKQLEYKLTEKILTNR